MKYGKAVKKAKAARSDHRKAKLPLVTSRRPKLDPVSFVTVERQHDPLGRFGASLGTIFFDSDGDGSEDTYGRRRRVVSVGGVLEVPTFGPIAPPVSGPTNLLAAEIISAPSNGPTELGASVNAPANGPTELDASVNAPIAGPTVLGASVNAPAEGPTTLGASEVFTAPASGPTELGASVNAPAEGPTVLGASVNAPAEGPTGLSAAKLTLNINIEASQDTLVAKTTEPAGTIEYASDVEYLFIYDGTDWQRTNGGNS